MLDLAKPLGAFEGVVFYGDHEQDRLVYYLPDEVGLAPVEQTDGSKTYDFFLQIFKEGLAVHGGLDMLEQSSGAIMSLGVQCVVSPERLEKASKKLLATHELPEGIFFSPPEWHDGKIDLMVLDATTQDETTIGEDAFVEGIIGARKPSLAGSDLKAVFNVRLDRKGTSLVAAALQGDRSQVAGVLYELDFKAIRPALDLRISADLDRCYDKVAEIISLKASVTYYVNFSAGAEFENIKDKLEEEGLIKVEVLSQVTDPEMKKLVHETVEDFKDKVMRELFSPMINPGDIPVPDLGLGQVVPQVGVGYKLQKKTSVHNKKIEIDYRERSVTLKKHTPQAHLWLLGLQIQNQLDLYTQTVSFSELWRENHVKVSLLHDFEAEQNDLLSAEVLIWRKKEGKLQEPGSSGFQMPETSDALASFTFSKNQQEEKPLAWITDKDEPTGYYYQLKFTYSQRQPNLSTPLQLLSPVIFSSSQDLLILPDVLVPTKFFEFKVGAIDFTKLSHIDVILRAKNQQDEVIDQEVLQLSQQGPVASWGIRSSLTEQVFIEAEKHYHFSDGKPTLKEAPALLVDREIIINDPFAFNQVHIIPVVVGGSASFLELFLELEYEPIETAYAFRKLLRSSPPDFSLQEIKIPVLQEHEQVNWRFSGVSAEGAQVLLDEGQTGGGALILDLKKTKQKVLERRWEGRSPEQESLDYVLLEFKLRQNGGEEKALEPLRFTGAAIPGSIAYEYPAEGTLLMREVKRFRNGRKEKTGFEAVSSPVVIIKP